MAPTDRPARRLPRAVSNRKRRYRARLYEYRFASWAEHRATGNGWKREENGEYLPAISLKNFDRR